MDDMVSRFTCALLVLSLTACVQESDDRNRDDVMVLILGGEIDSLTQSLQAPPPWVQDSLVEDELPDQIQHQEQQELTPPPRRTQTEEPKFRVVLLADGQTLYGLCQAHLGNGNRWREIAAFNGWSEDQAQLLPVGQRVKFPIE